MEKTFLTQTELAKRWGFSPSTLAFWRKNNTGPKFHRRGGRQIVYFMEDIIEHEKENPALAVL